MKNHIVLIFIGIGTIISLGSCINLSTYKPINCNFSLEDFQELLGKNLDVSVEKFSNCFTSKDTIFEGDDGVNWKGVAFYDNDEVCFVVESNWQKPDTIYQVNIISERIEIREEIGIGKEFKYLSQFASKKIPSMPDGYLALKDKKYDGVLYFMNIDSFPVLFYGVSDLRDIPDSLKIQNIIIK